MGLLEILGIIYVLVGVAFFINIMSESKPGDTTLEGCIFVFVLIVLFWPSVLLAYLLKKFLN